MITAFSRQIDRRFTNYGAFLRGLKESALKDFAAVGEARALVSRRSWSHAGVDDAPQLRNRVGQCLYIGLRGMEIHDARPQRILTANDSVRHECLAAALCSFQQVSIERVKMAFRDGFTDTRSQIERDCKLGTSRC